MIRLQVATNTGVVNVVEHNVGLSGELKLGNFQLTFTDLVLPVVGIPIEVTRVYDSLDVDIESELGFGWRLEFRDTDLRVGLPESGLEDIGIHTAFRAGTKVFLNIPGQGRVGFTFTPEIRVLPGFDGENLVLARPRFTADPGVSATLSPGVSGFLRVNEFGELIGPGGIPYNPASTDFGGVFVATTATGISYRIDGQTGLLTNASDTVGNSVVFNDDEIAFSNGLNISILRDTNNRISSIVAPDGSTIDYQYSATGESECSCGSGWKHIPIPLR